jgi:Radical SAM superfamily.
MNKIGSNEVAIALDMCGCPNRCRHCWLGYSQNRKMSEQDLRWTAARFKKYLPCKLGVMSWFREPDFSDDYEKLYALEAELSDIKPYRFELLSTWRLARDEKYAKWAKKVGTDACQITLFGMEKTNDWFYRRRGAFQDCLTATERLLDVGIKPRWQIFLTKTIIPEIEELLELVDHLELRDRVKNFDLFMHTPGPEGEARKIEYLRLTLEDTRSIPDEIIESSCKYLNVEKLWHTESELISQILSEKEEFPYAYSCPKILCFYINSNWDVFSNMGTLDPWWKLGNLQTNSVQSIFDNFENNRVLGMKTIFTHPVKELANRFGNPDSTLMYSSKEDLEALWVAKHEQLYLNGQ